MKSNCPFCQLDTPLIIKGVDLSIIIRDKFAVSPGHTLIISKRHISSFFEATSEEKIALLNGIEQAKALINKEFSPDGYNIGINDGEAAGQTIEHLHIHLIPRYKGDSPDPRGGIRWIFPEKAKYWEDNE